MSYVTRYASIVTAAVPAPKLRSENTTPGEILVLDAITVRAACSMAEAIEAVDEGFRALSAGTADVPLRSQLDLGEMGSSLFLMPASLTDSPFVSVKLVSAVPQNSLRSLPTIQAAVLVFDRITGTALALLEGAALTALRTGAAGGLAARQLAREDAKVAALYGAGPQARAQLEAVLAVRSLEEVRVVTRDPSHAEDFIASFRGREGLRVRFAKADAVVEADIVICATTSSAPVFSAADIRPGVHITGVGSYRPTMCEIPPETFRGARVVVDERSAAVREAGEVIEAIRRGYITAGDLLEIGEKSARRSSPSERTIFKSVGNAVQDLVVAVKIYKNAVSRGLGVTIRL